MISENVKMFSDFPQTPLGTDQALCETPQFFQGMRQSLFETLQIVSEACLKILEPANELSGTAKLFTDEHLKCSGHYKFISGMRQKVSESTVTTTGATQSLPGLQQSAILAVKIKEAVYRYACFFRISKFRRTLRRSRHSFFL